MRVHNKYKNEKEIKYVSFDDTQGLEDYIITVKVAALFWRSVADLSSGVSSHSDQKYVLSLPGVPIFICNQLLEIFEWSKDKIDSSDTCLVSASLDTSISQSIPVIIFERFSTAQAEVTLEANNDVDEDTISLRTKAWVNRILVDLGICPFTKSDTMSGQGLKDFGIPVAKIAYHVSSAKNTEIASLMANW